MAESRNFKELLLLLNLNECLVEYLIVGGYAVMRYSEPRFTKDLDIWVGNSLDNSKRVFAALARFGAPLKHDGVAEDTFCVDQTVYQIGVPPVRVDVLTTITGCVLKTHGRRPRPLPERKMQATGKRWPAPRTLSDPTYGRAKAFRPELTITTYCFPSRPR